MTTPEVANTASAGAVLVNFEAEAAARQDELLAAWALQAAGQDPFGRAVAAGLQPSNETLWESIFEATSPGDPEAIETYGLIARSETLVAERAWEAGLQEIVNLPTEVHAGCILVLTEGQTDPRRLQSAIAKLHALPDDDPEVISARVTLFTRAHEYARALQLLDMSKSRIGYGSQKHLLLDIIAATVQHEDHDLYTNIALTRLREENRLEAEISIFEAGRIPWSTVADKIDRRWSQSPPRVTAKAIAAMAKQSPGDPNVHSRALTIPFAQGMPNEEDWRTEALLTVAEHEAHSSLFSSARDTLQTITAAATSIKILSKQRLPTIDETSTIQRRRERILVRLANEALNKSSIMSTVVTALEQGVEPALIAAAALAEEGAPAYKDTGIYIRNTARSEIAKHLARAGRFNEAVRAAHTIDPARSRLKVTTFVELANIRHTQRMRTAAGAGAAAIGTPHPTPKSVS